MADSTRTADAVEPEAGAVREILGSPAQLRVALQPVARLVDFRVVGYEALARFPARASAAVDLHACFAFAHGAALATPLQALALGRALAKRAVLPSGCYLAANLSGGLLATREIQQILENAAPLRDVVIELTERHPLQSLAECRRAVRWLRGLGGRIGVDDVGGGYATLERLVELEPEIVKIDGSLIRGLDRDERRRCVVQSIVTAGDDLGATVVAQGIEAPGELRALCALGVPCGQGCLLGGPSLEPPRRLPATLPPTSIGCGSRVEA